MLPSSFDVSPGALLPALDRFSQFFHSPTFDPSCTERELRAVDSEHSKNLQVRPLQDATRRIIDAEFAVTGVLSTTAE